MALHKAHWQKVLGTSVDVLVTGATGGSTEIPTIFVHNTNTTTDREFMLFLYGSGEEVGNQFWRETLSPGETRSFLLGSDPIVLLAGDTLRGRQTIGEDITVTLIGFNEVSA